MGYVIRFRPIGPDADMVEEAMRSAKKVLDDAGIPYEERAVDSALDNGGRAVGAGLILGGDYSDKPSVEYIWRGENEDASSDVSSFIMTDDDEDDPFVVIVSGIINEWFDLDLVDDVEMFDDEEDDEDDEDDDDDD